MAIDLENLRAAAPVSARWPVVAIGFLALSLAFSARAALGLVMPVWQVELQWSRGMISAGGAVALIVMAAVAPIAGSWVDRRGPALLLGGGLGLIGVGFLGLSLVSAPWLFFLAYAGTAALGFGLIATHVVATAIAGVFQQGRGLATGIATSGATAGQLFVVPLLALALGGLGWRAALGTLGATCLLLAPAAYALTARLARRPSTGGVRAPLDARLRFLARSPTFHALFWSFALCGFTTTGVIETHLLPYAAACGFSPLSGASAYGVLSGVNLAGMVIAGYLSDRVNRPLLLGAIYLMRAACFVLLLYVPADIRLLFLFAVVFGVFDYSTVPVTASLVASHLGLRVMGLAMGIISAGHAAGGALGAYLGGVLFDLLARYDGLWLIALGLAVVAGLAALTVRERVPATVAPATAN